MVASCSWTLMVLRSDRTSADLLSRCSDRPYGGALCWPERVTRAPPAMGATRRRRVAYHRGRDRLGGRREASPSPVYGAALLMRFGVTPHPGFKSRSLRSDLRFRVCGSRASTTRG